MASRKILAVDDSVSIRKSISFILGQENFEVVEAENGADGLAKATALVVLTIIWLIPFVSLATLLDILIVIVL